MTEPIAWFNGRLIAARDAALPVTDLGLQGIAVTETIRTVNHQPFRLEAHLDRLFRSLKLAAFNETPARDELAAAAAQVVEHNARLIPSSHDLGIVIFVTPGPNATYIGAAGMRTARRSTACVHTFPLPFALWADKLERGQHLVVPSVRQVPPETLSPAIKSRSRMHWYLADREARRIESHASALILDANGQIAETATANFFAVFGGRIQTPPPGWILEGVSRQVVFELAAELGLECVERNMTPEDAAGANEAFTSSTPYCLLPVTRLNGRPLGDGRPGPVFRQLSTRWSELVGLDIMAQIRQAASERRACP